MAEKTTQADQSSPSPVREEEERWYTGEIRLHNKHCPACCDQLRLSNAGDVFKRALRSARGNRLMTEESYFRIPVDENGYPIELWEAGFKGLAGHRIPYMLDAACRNDSPVLILGESGTGKEVLARYIHNSGKRKDAPFVAVNCAAYPGDLLYSEIFGHTQGAFTGANHPKSGKFEIADRGTLFLDEIGDLQPPVQLALLRFLEDKLVARLGSIEAKRVDVRIVCATHRAIDSQSQREKTNFRDDLYYRLKVLPLKVDPLCESREEIPFLFMLFFRESSDHRICRQALFPISLFEEIIWYDWPGNVRELKHFAEFYVEFAKTNRQNARCYAGEGAIFEYLTQPSALELFLGEEAFEEVAEKVATISSKIMEASGIPEWTPIGLPHLYVAAHPRMPASDHEDMQCHHAHTYDAQPYLRHFLARVTNDSEVLRRAIKDPTNGSGHTGKYFNAAGRPLKLRQVLQQTEEEYVQEVFGALEGESHYALEGVTGIHHDKIKRLRRNFQLS